MKIKSRSSYEKRLERYGIMFILPWLIGLVLFFIKPIAYSLYYSFSSISFGADGIESAWIGFKNYNEIFFENTEYLPALLDAFKNIVSEVPLILAISLFLGLILSKKFIGRTFSRVVLFLPVIIASSIVITLLKNDIFAQNIMKGDVNSTLFNATGITSMLNNMNVPSKITEALTGVINNIFDLIWQSGIQILLFLSAIQSIPKSFYEAAQIEGANAWISFWKITFPMLLPTVLVATVYSIIDSFTGYDNPVIKLIDVAYKENMRYAYASAMSWGYFVLIMIVLALVFFFVGRNTKHSEY
ncbi:MAG: sugar ABC transporter permease [Ruminococcaceae bacterium]|nr:sugar ABC transporter permease [Oscillospiraceae bacterium]